MRKFRLWQYKDHFLKAAIIVLSFCIGVFAPILASASFWATTSVSITICGDGIVGFGEVCDFGPAFNDGQYATSTANRHCSADCKANAPYCGDAILQPFYGEQCDDGNNVDGDGCSALCVQETPPSNITPASQPPQIILSNGSGADPNGIDPGKVLIANPTQVTVSGKAYPSAVVHILKDGTDITTVQADPFADFHYDFSGPTAGLTTFGFWAQDKGGLRSPTLTTTFQVVERAITTVTGIFLPPTIDAVKLSIAKGEPLKLHGTSVPRAPILTNIDTHTATGTMSAVDGAWDIAIDTSLLKDESFHAVKAFFTDVSNGSPIQSGFSQLLSFYVGTREPGATVSVDVNHDGKVNLIDFSVLLFYWGQDEPSVDFNHDGKVGIADFSILLFNWTG